MSDILSFTGLPVREQAIVAIAVLLDGIESPDYLQSTYENRAHVLRGAADLVKLAPDLRLPFAGTMLRRAIAQLSAKLETNEYEYG